MLVGMSFCGLSEGLTLERNSRQWIEIVGWYSWGGLRSTVAGYQQSQGPLQAVSEFVETKDACGGAGIWH